MARKKVNGSFITRMGSLSNVETTRTTSLMDLGNGGMQWVRIGKDIYNVTQYVDGLTHNLTNTIDKDLVNTVRAIDMRDLHNFMAMRHN